MVQSEGHGIKAKDQKGTQPISKEVPILSLPTEQNGRFCDNNVSTTTCVFCRVRKIRCDLALPECANCERLGLPCAYVDVTGKGKGKAQLSQPRDVLKDEKGDQPVSRDVGIAQLREMLAALRRQSHPTSPGHVPGVQEASNSASQDDLPPEERGRIPATCIECQGNLHSSQMLRR
ncbi:hypothetical protein OG21DRAFT_755391 [Imleria badia]|nr:hypothetical protein OG21DRAFT_755391 [Imleria badia]